MLEVTDIKNIFVSFPPLNPIHLPYHIMCHPLPLCISYLSHLHLLFAVQSDPWMAVCRSPTGRGFPMLSTAACGDGRTFTATMSCAPSRPVSMPSTSRRTRSASTPTTTRGWRPQVRRLPGGRLLLKTQTCLYISVSSARLFPPKCIGFH